MDRYPQCFEGKHPSKVTKTRMVHIISMLEEKLTELQLDYEDTQHVRDSLDQVFQSANRQIDLMVEQAECIKRLIGEFGYRSAALQEHRAASREEIIWSEFSSLLETLLEDLIAGRKTVSQENAEDGLKSLSARVAELKRLNPTADIQPM